jgi:hypothetical protein
MEITVRSITLAQLFRLVAGSRAATFMSSIVYAIALTYCLSTYAAVEWPDFGFSFSRINPLDATVVFTSVLIWSFVLPKRIDRPSALFLIIIYLFVCVPGVVTIVGLDSISGRVDYLLILTLTIGFAFSCIMVRSFSWSGQEREISQLFKLFVIISWAICLGYLLFSFSSIMSFSYLDVIYAQRERGAAANLVQGYAQTYFGYVFSPALIVFGLIRKNYICILAGFFGSLVLYMITAEKAVFVYPFFVVVMFAILQKKINFMTSVTFIASGFSFLLFLSVFFYQDSSIARFVSWYLGVRSLLIPGVFITLYSEFFGEHGHTLWGHIRGIDLLSDTPARYLSDPRWPSIGLLVGEDYLGIPTLNANANFIASDGVASFGLIGVLVVLVLFSVFLILLDRCSRGIPLALIIPIMVPISLTLTNGSLFTALTSFGGLFWILFFTFAVKRQICAKGQVAGALHDTVQSTSCSVQNQ